MLGEKVRVGFQNCIFYIKKNKVKIWMVWPFHSCLPRTPSGRGASSRAGEGAPGLGLPLARAPPSSHSVLGCRYLLFHLIIFFILKC